MEVRSTFSEDVLEEILARLTVRQLLQLRCVSKTWCSLIDKHNFMTKHYIVQYARLKEQGHVALFADHPSVFGKDDPVEFYLVSKAFENVVLCLTPNLHRDSAPYFVDNQEWFNTLCCMGGVNGVALLHWEDENLGLWNPARREFKVLPRARPNKPDNVIERMAIFIGMGFDPKSHDIKIVRQIDWLVRKDDDWETTTINEMYSLRTNSWKSVDLPWDSLIMYDATWDGYFNGVYYWTANEMDNSTCSTRRIWFLTFNFGTEVFKLIDPPPPACQDGPKPEWNISKYMDFLAVVFMVEGCQENEILFEIWIMSKFDDEGLAISSSWQHLLTVGPLPPFDGLWFTAFLDGDMLFTAKGGEGVSATITGGCETALYSLTTRAFKRLGVGLCTCPIYVESLFSLSIKA